MIPRPTFAQVAAGLLLSTALAVVLYESNTRQSRLNLRASVGVSSGTAESGSTPASSPTAAYCCTGSGNGLCEQMIPGVTQCSTLATNDPACGGLCQSAVSSSSSPAATYCCDVTTYTCSVRPCVADGGDCSGGRTCCEGASTCEVNDDTNEMVCVPGSPCTAEGGDCSGSACCGGTYCNTESVCVPGTSE